MGYRIAIYTRLSRDPDGAQTATERQEADCRAVAAVRGWEVAQTYSDVDLSAYRRGVERPGWEQLLADLEAGVVDGVLVWKLDRLVRRASEFERFWTVCEDADAVLASATEPIDTSNELGITIVRILVAFAQLESATMSVRIRSALEAKARRGGAHKGGRRPYGLDPTWTQLIPDEAARVREACDRILAGDSLRSIVLDWNRQEVPSASGGTWSTQALRRLLLSRRLAGEREHHGDVVGAGDWPAIVDAEVLDRVAVVLNDPTRRTRVGRPASHLLTGILRCGKCGARMRTSTTINGRRRYACPPKPDGCNGVTIVADPTDELVARQVLARLRDATLPAEPRLEVAGDEHLLVAELTAVDEALVELAGDYYQRRALGRAEYFATRDGIAAQAEDLRARLDQLRAGQERRRIAAHGPDLADTWPDLPLDDRRALVSALVDSVVVAVATRGNRFDPGRVELAWRR